MRATSEELKVLKNLSEGKDFVHGFAQQAPAIRAMFTCITNGWVNRGQLTQEGRAALRGGTPLKGNFYQITILDEKKKTSPE